MTKPQHKKLYLATQACPLCSTLTSKDSDGIEQTEQRAPAVKLIKRNTQEKHLNSHDACNSLVYQST